MPLLSGSQLLTADGASGTASSGTSTGTLFKRPATAAAARWCMVAVQVAVQAWLLVAYVLQVPALQGVLLKYSETGNKANEADPRARGIFSLFRGVPIIGHTHLPGSFLGFRAAFGCPDARSLATALLGWLGFPLSSGDGEGGAGGEGRGVLPPEVQLLLGLQCAVLAVAALRLKARG